MVEILYFQVLQDALNVDKLMQEVNVLLSPG